MFGNARRGRQPRTAVRIRPGLFKIFAQFRLRSVTQRRFEPSLYVRSLRAVAADQREVGCFFSADSHPPTRLQQSVLGPSTYQYLLFERRYICGQRTLIQVIRKGKREPAAAGSVGQHDYRWERLPSLHPPPIGTGLSTSLPESVPPMAACRSSITLLRGVTIVASDPSIDRVPSGLLSYLSGGVEFGHLGSIARAVYSVFVRCLMSLRSNSAVLHSLRH